MSTLNQKIKSITLRAKPILASWVALLLLFASSLFAQETESTKLKFEKAQDAYKASNYFQALPLYLEIYSADSSNANIAYLVGQCYAEGRKGRAKSIWYLEKAVLHTTDNYKENSFEEKNAPILAYKILGDEYHSLSKFDKAIASYEKYKSTMVAEKEHDKENIKDTDRKIQMCITAKYLVAHPVKVQIDNMGTAVNSMYGDYSPVLTIDQNTMIFTSRRSGGEGNKLYENGRYYEDIYISRRTKKGWSKAENIGKPINTDGNEASVGISPDGQEILIYKDDKGDGNIYSTTLSGDTWSEPIKLNDNINSKNWEPSAFMSADGYAIYFTSNRPGGYGGRDLYVSYKNEKNDWGKAENMGPIINTEYDEDAPFIHPDGVTLFFASNGHNTMGGFDIFYTSLSADGITWNTPTNVGYPINSPDDDVFYVVSPDKTKAYYTSFKEGGTGEKDNYIVSFLDKQISPLVVVTGTIKDAEDNVPKGIEITVTDNNTGKVLGVYKPNSKTGMYMFVLTAGKNYNIAYEADGYMFYSENRQVAKNTNYYETSKAIKLPPLVVGSRIVLNNIFFDFDKSTLRQTSNIELKNILKFLTKYPKLFVELDGFTDSKGTKEYNEKLSQDRAAAVVAYLVNNGIDKARLTSKGYGETKPDAPNEDAEGNDNPEGRQLNRRVELKIVEIK